MASHVFEYVILLLFSILMLFTFIGIINGWLDPVIVFGEKVGNAIKDLLAFW